MVRRDRADGRGRRLDRHGVDRVVPRLVGRLAHLLAEVLGNRDGELDRLALEGAERLGLEASCSVGRGVLGAVDRA